MAAKLAVQPYLDGVGYHIDVAIDGGTASELDAAIIDAMRQLDALRRGEAMGNQLAGSSIDYLLTKRERQVVELILRGLSNKEIARELKITVNTLDSHVRNIYGKVDVKSKAQLVIAANGGGR